MQHIMKKTNPVKDGYPYTGIVDWDLEALEKKITDSKRSNTLPSFGLKRIEIHPTSMCQYNCPFCYGMHFKHKLKVDLPLNIFENNILKSIKNSKLIKDDPIIILAGLYSEPLAHADQIELIKLLGKYKFRFGLYTNGGFLNENIMRVICESAKKNKSQRKSYVSLNVIGAILNGDYNALESKIKYFVKIRDSIKAPVQFNVPILIDGNLSAGELKKLQNRLLKIGINKIRYSIPQVPVLANKEQISILKNIKLIEALRHNNENNIFLRSISGKEFDCCYIMANTVSIDHNGFVYPCSQTCSSNFKLLSYGSIKKKGLDEIWNSPEHMKMYKNFNKIPTYCRCNISDQRFNSVCSFLNN